MNSPLVHFVLCYGYLHLQFSLLFSAIFLLHLHLLFPLSNPYLLLSLFFCPPSCSLFLPSFLLLSLLFFSSSCSTFSPSPILTSSLSSSPPLPALSLPSLLPLIPYPPSSPPFSSPPLTSLHSALTLLPHPLQSPSSLSPLRSTRWGRVQTTLLW